MGNRLHTIVKLVGAYRRPGEIAHDLVPTLFCLIDDQVPAVPKGKPLRTRGPAPRLWDSEVLTIEVGGSYPGLSQDKALYDYFRRHYAHFFHPRLAFIARPWCFVPVVQYRSVWFSTGWSLHYTYTKIKGGLVKSRYKSSH
jgi:hypothetical protein